MSVRTAVSCFGGADRAAHLAFDSAARDLTPAPTVGPQVREELMLGAKPLD